jgi:hypothetical protein
MCMIDKQRIAVVARLESRLHHLRYHACGGEWIAAHWDGPRWNAFHTAVICAGERRIAVRTRCKAILRL